MDNSFGLQEDEQTPKSKDFKKKKQHEQAQKHHIH